MPSIGLHNAASFAPFDPVYFSSTKSFAIAVTLFAHRFRAEKAALACVSYPVMGLRCQPYLAFSSAIHRDVAAWACDGLQQDRLPARCPDFALTPHGRSIKFRAGSLGSTVLIS
jgi:hypothetical protein